MTTTLPRRRDTIAALPELRRDAASSGAAADWTRSLEGRKAPRTIAQYVGTVNDLLDAEPDLEPDEFDEGHLERLLNGYPIKSRRIRRSHLNSLFKYWRRRRIIPENPVDMIEDYPGQPKPIHRIFTPGEVDSLTTLPTPDGELMRLLLDTGLRAGEACRLQVRNVRIDEHFVEIVRSKRGKSRLIPLTRRLEQQLADWFEQDGMELDTYLFYSTPAGRYRDHSHQVKYSTFARWWRRCIDGAMVDYRNPHVTRHTFATMAKRSGVDTDDLRRILGHEKIATTVEQYVHSSIADLAEAVDRFEEATA